MRAFIEPSREIPVLDEADVVVCGGGPAGAAAAIAAARNGAKTVLIEYQCCLGGMATSGMMNRLGPYHDQQKMIVGGIPWEALDRLIAMGAAHAPTPCPHDDPDRYWIPFDPEAMKIILDAMAEEAGVSVLLHSMGVGVVREGGRPGGVIVESKSGRGVVPAKVIVDATGDGDIAVAAGARYEKGRPEDGLTQPMTLLFKVANLDRDKAKQFLAANRKAMIEEARTKGEAIPRYVGPGTDNLLRPDETYFNVDQVHEADGTNVRDLARAAVEARKQIWQSVRFLQKHVPGCERAFLSATASQLGVRESRRIVGDYALTVQDVLGARRSGDAIAHYACWVDIHTVKPGEKRGPHSGKGPAPGTSYGIPYRCLIPAGVENVLVAGRCFSATHEAFASARMIPCCMAMGQAAGTAAALAVKGAKSPREMDINRLQDALRAQGAYIERG